MSKKKHPEHVNHERWLVSYADFITLLFAFFVVLFASGQTDKRKQVKLAEAMQSAFTHQGIFDPHSKTPPMSDMNATPTAAQPSPLALPLPSALEAEQEVVARHIEQVIQKQVAEQHLGEGLVSIRPTQEGLVVSLREAGFFSSGSADLRPDSTPVLQAVAASLPHGNMRVEGHTDSIPIHTGQFSTNWELSTARAACITRLLLAQGATAPQMIAAAGYAEFRPVASNDTEAGRARNRRVDIVLLSKPGPTQN